MSDIDETSDAKRRQQEEEIKPYHYYEQTLQKKIHHFYLSSQIVEQHHYVDMIHKIHNAGPEEAIYLHLNTPGGYLTTGVQMLNAMRASNAHIIASAESHVASLGTLLFLAADEYIVHDHSFMMFHNYSGGVSGKGHEQLAALDATSKWFRSIAEKYYIPFMSQEEFNRMMNGEDLYFHSEQIRKRLNKMIKEQKKTQKEQNKGTKEKKTSHTKTDQ